MRKQFIGLIIGLMFALVAVAITEAALREIPSAENAESSSLCPSSLQLRHPQRCSNGEARPELNELVMRGFYPQHPLPVLGVDPALGSLSFTYLKSGSRDGTPVYNNLQNALKGKHPYRTVEPGFVYFSWIDLLEENGTKVFMIAPGVYIRTNGTSRISLTTFRGVSLSRTPDRPFAWVLNRVETSSGPGYTQETGRWLNRYDIVWVYAVERVGDWDWYQVGPSDWIEQRLLGIVTPDTKRPEGVEDNRWIAVNLYEQTLGVYEDGELVYATLVSSGLEGWWTQPGTFQVYSRLESDPMVGAFASDRSDFYYLEDVPWILYYDQSRALHGAYWHNGFGYPRSHGCVNLSLADANWIFNWAQEGTWVYVFDPSGRTPTDPDEYGAGGV